MTLFGNLTGDLNNIFGSIGGNNIFGGGSNTNNTNTSSNPISGVLDGFKSKVSVFANMGTYILVGGAIVGLIIVMK